MSATLGTDYITVPVDKLREFVAWADSQRIAVDYERYADPREFDASDREFAERLRALGLPEDFLDEVYAA